MVEQEDVEMPDGIRRIVVVKPEGAVTVYKEDRKRKKTAGELRPLRRLLRGVAKARAVSADEYLRRFDRSDNKKKNGWLRGHVWNTLQAAREGNKVLRKINVF